MPAIRNEMEAGSVSTSLSQAHSESLNRAWTPNSEEDWKLEVNRRLAAHQSRKGLSAVAPASTAKTMHSVDSRAAQAAARVAARYAKAPSYSEMQTAEARHAVRAAEIATQAALDAQAAAQAVLAGLEAAIGNRENWEIEPPDAVRTEPVLKSMSVPVELAAPLQISASMAQDAAERGAAERQPYAIRWESDTPVWQAKPVAARVSRTEDSSEIRMEDWWEPASPTKESLATPAIEAVEPAQPIFANLIEFPRELVATRKARPRLAEGPLAAISAAGAQLSIFEVDPEAISIEPETAGATAPAEPEWSRMELDAQPSLATEAEDEAGQAAPVIELASLSRRLMAAVVDGALIVGAFLTAAAVAASKVHHLPSLKASEIGAVVALLVTAVLYLAFFSLVTEATLGMKYAGISLCTFDDEFPTRAERRKRLGALMLSLLPMGLGIVWGLFDEEHLSWHDRLSRTYQREC